MKKNVLVFIAVLLTVSGYAQKTADIGIWGGATSYWGDLTKINYSQSVNPMFGAFFRYNFNARTGLRVQYLTGKIGAVGYIGNEQWTNFGPKQIHDISVMVEINYLKYILGYKKTPFSPYILAGFGLKYFPYNLNPALIYRFNPANNKGGIPIDKSVISPSIPFGMGIKTHIGDRFGIGIEFLISKLFSDKLDNLDDPMAHINPLGKEITYTDFLHNNDYTAYIGINLTYKVYLGKQVCPAYDSKN
jgi:hypothetical protein